MWNYIYLCVYVYTSLALYKHIFSRFQGIEDVSRVHEKLKCELKVVTPQEIFPVGFCEISVCKFNMGLYMICVPYYICGPDMKLYMDL